MSSPAGRHPIVRAARAQLDLYGRFLSILSASPSETGVEQLVGALGRSTTEPGVLFIDYLQKVRADRLYSSREAELAATTASLQEFALSRNIAIVAIAAAQPSGLSVRRLRLHHLEAPSVVGYEADVVILLNDKAMAVSRVHLTFETDKIERMRRLVVFSVEKNRGGMAMVDLEFEKDFSRYRFLSKGAFVSERLVDEQSVGD